jgi:ABC-type Fe3+/spermidine/putrescine transport system ATPase subunit
MMPATRREQMAAVRAKPGTGRREEDETITSSVQDPPPRLVLSGVRRRFGDVTAVDGVDLQVRDGEIFALLGPSGCGKTTLLRMVAGLEPVDGGSIVMAGREIANASMSVPPNRRNIAMVFQSYAVWPHMTVSQNVAFPLRMRRVARSERSRRVRDILEITGLSGVADRPATMLSGGQQQRVALARALVYTPDLLLLDEPLSNLDAALRVQMRREIRRLNQELGIPMLFVTHDQDEALSVADRVAVLNRGRVEQMGTPRELYEQPATQFVRDFIGRLIPMFGELRRSGGEATVQIDGSSAVVAGIAAEQLADVAHGTALGLYVRPEDVQLTSAADGVTPPNHVPATVQSWSYLGDRIEYIIDLGRSTAVVTSSGREPFAAGSEIALVIDPSRVSVWLT